MSGWQGARRRRCRARAAQWSQHSRALLARIGDHAQVLHTGTARFRDHEQRSAQGAGTPGPSVSPSVAEIERWDAGDVREVFHAATGRAWAAFDAADGLADLPALGTWGRAAEASDAIGRTRMDLDPMAPRRWRSPRPPAAPPTASTPSTRSGPAEGRRRRLGPGDRPVDRLDRAAPGSRPTRRLLEQAGPAAAGPAHRDCRTGGLGGSCAGHRHPAGRWHHSAVAVAARR